MSETSTAGSTVSAPAPVNPVSDISAGVVQARIVTGAKRLQVLVNDQWWDVDGVSAATVFTTDPRFAGAVTFHKISTISPAGAGMPAGSVPAASVSKIAPTRTSSFSTLSVAGSASTAAASEPSASAKTPAA